MPVIYIRCVRQLHGYQRVGALLQFSSNQGFFFLIIKEGGQACWTVLTQTVTDYVVCSVLHKT